MAKGIPSAIYNELMAEIIKPIDYKKIPLSSVDRIKDQIRHGCYGLNFEKGWFTFKGHDVPLKIFKDMNYPGTERK